MQTEERVIVVGGIAVLQHLQGHHDGIELQRGGSWGPLCPNDIYLVLKHDVPIAPDLGHRLLHNAQVGHGGCGERQPTHAVGPQPSRNNRGRGDAEIGAFGGRSRWASDRIGRPATSTARQAKQCLGGDWLFLCVPRRWCTTELLHSGLIGSPRWRCCCPPHAPALPNLAISQAESGSQPGLRPTILRPQYYRPTGGAHEARSDFR